MPFLNKNQSYALLRLMPYPIFKLSWKCIYLSTKRTVPCRVWLAVLDQGGFIAGSPINTFYKVRVTTSSRLFLPNKALNLLNRRDLELRIVQLLELKYLFIVRLHLSLTFGFHLWARCLPWLERRSAPPSLAGPSDPQLNND